MSPMVRKALGIELALLGFLEPQPRHGYDIHQELAGTSGLAAVWYLKQSHLYALLAKLEQEGYTTATVESQEPKPSRKVYALTEAGRHTFQQWCVEPVAHGRAMRLEFLAKLYFARQAADGAVEQLLAAQRAAWQAWRADLLTQTASCPPGSYEWLICQFRMGQIEATGRWLDLCAAQHAVPTPPLRGGL